MCDIFATSEIKIICLHCVVHWFFIHALRCYVGQNPQMQHVFKKLKFLHLYELNFLTLNILKIHFCTLRCAMIF